MQIFVRAEQVELRKRELERQIMRDRTEDERKDSAVAIGKLIGSAPIRIADARIASTESLPFATAQSLFHPQLYLSPSAAPIHVFSAQPVLLLTKIYAFSHLRPVFFLPPPVLLSVVFLLLLFLLSDVFLMSLVF